MVRARRLAGTALAMVALLASHGCSGGGSDGAPDTPGNPSCAEGQAFDGTYDAIQTVIFERNGCTQDICHGSAQVGGLDLRRDASYDALF